MAMSPCTWYQPQGHVPDTNSVHKNFQTPRINQEIQSKRIDSARIKLKELEDELVVKYRKAATERGISVKIKCSKRALFVPECNVEKDDVILENCPAKRVSAEKQEKNAPSCLRLTSKEEIFGFTFEKLDEELTIKAPLVRSALMAISQCRSNKKDDDLFFTAAVFLKNRPRRLTAVQLLLTLMMRHSGFMVTLIRLGALRLTVSHTFLCKKLDKCGKGHLDAILKQVDADGKRFDHIPVPNQAVIPDIGRKIVIDNFNYTAQPHQMTLERQNDCVNWVAMLITENRVSGCGLDDRKPDIAKIFTVPNAIFLPHEIERNNQRKDYIALVGRQAVKHVKCLQFLEDVATKHIQHKYSSIMTKSTNLLL
eukprot:gene12580-13869_t